MSDFAPWNGIPEDPVNGSSHTVLGPWWAARAGRSRARDASAASAASTHVGDATSGVWPLGTTEAALATGASDGERDVVLGRLSAQQWSAARGELEVVTVGRLAAGVGWLPSWVMLAGRCAVVADSVVEGAR
jgi:hypothetical protein